MPIARYDLHCSWRESCSNLSNGHSKRWTMWRKSVWARYGKVYGNVYGIVYGNGTWQWVAMYGNAWKRTAAQGNVVNECMCLSLSTMDPSILTWQAYRGQEVKKKVRKETNPYHSALKDKSASESGIQSGYWISNCALCPLPSEGRLGDFGRAVNMPEDLL